MKILIADDDLVSRKLLLTYLQRWGYEVNVAQHGAEAWQMFEAGEFPLVITDWMMPELDGVGLIRRIRASQRLGYVYTILLTSRAQKEDLVEGMDAGADDFVTKPFDRDELRVRLRAGERIVKLEQHLRDAEVSLSQSGKLADLGRMAAGVAHEINSPITTVISNLAVLRRDVLAALHMLDKCFSGLSAAEQAASPPDVPAGVNVSFLKSHLTRLFDQSLDSLERVGDSVRKMDLLDSTAHPAAGVPPSSHLDHPPR